MGELAVIENREVLLGARYLPQEEGGEYFWHLVIDHVSDLMEYTMSPSWQDRVNSEHYRDLWGDLLDELNGREGPVQIILDAVYEFGMLTQEGVSKYLDDNTGKGPQFLTVFASTDSEMPMSCIWMRGWDISDIAMTEKLQAKVRQQDEP